MHAVDYKLQAALLQLFRGRHLRVDLANGEGSSKDPKLSVFIGNLPFTATEEGLRTWVAPAVDGGNDSITNVRLVRDKATNRGKGIAYVAFRVRVPVFRNA